MVFYVSLPTKGSLSVALVDVFQAPLHVLERGLHQRAILRHVRWAPDLERLMRIDLRLLLTTFSDFARPQLLGESMCEGSFAALGQARLLEEMGTAYMSLFFYDFLALVAL